jgi:alpha-beta hydrolase superfamily lysophospholipase
MKLETTLHTADNLKLVGEHHLVPNQRGEIVMIHGFAEHRRRYKKLISDLTGNGYACHLVDLRGHGDSEGTRGYVIRFSQYRDDLDLFLKQAFQESLNAHRNIEGERSVPWIVFGHSFGGLLALNYVLHRPSAFDAVAVSSPFLAPAFRLPRVVDFIGPLAAYCLPKLPLPNSIEPEWLSRDAAIVEAYRKDPLVFSTVTPKWWYVVRDAQEETSARAPEIKVPVLFLLGDSDRLADWHHSRYVFERMGSANKTLKIYPGFFHELFNEIGREEVTQDFIAWLANVAFK